MNMVQFAARFPDLGIREMRVLRLNGYGLIPDDEYALFEYYCPDPACDCRRVVIHVVAHSDRQVHATINYGWESLAFYQRWMGDPRAAADCQGPALDPLNPQSIFAPAFLELFHHVIQDPTYVARLQQHYRLFKSGLQPTSAPRPPKRIPKKGKRRR